MNKREKQEWILEYVNNSATGHVDIFNSEFVEWYIEKCKPKKIIFQPYGANTVPELGKILSEMYHGNLLDRCTIGLTQCYSGFPKWCYSYYLRER